ncbi:hypothetical protein P280DRAFT_554324 [Massarina eburnea CBS 473.64]|uniref:Integral membrane protein n=1 Tax=Massarina eburnea CBS 473.64 TaxID=1395130 RepID=A0A6A6RL99_9PLEO|nr:hypothetical protein P280DRAFT_554324 [Massarina eburnea CBS 473.64]
MSFIQRASSAAPAGYVTPEFPSLYWPLPLHGTQRFYLYNPNDIWRYTMLWSVMFFGAIHFTAAAWACVVQWRNWKFIWITPVVYLVVGGLEGFIAGSVVGGLLGGVYQAGYFRMSTWIPFVWALVNALVLILSSFAIHGGL